MDSPAQQSTSAELTRALARVVEAGGVAVLATLVEAEQGIGAKVLFEADGMRIGTTGDEAFDEALAEHACTFLASRMEARTLSAEEFATGLEAWRGARVLFERVEPEPHLVVCGAGHVGAALARLAHAIGYRVTLVDDREEFVARSRFTEEDIELVAAQEWTETLKKVVGTGRGVYVAVVTRGHNEDEECMRAVLDARPEYVGMIGSRRRTNIVLGRLRESGVDEEVLKEVRAPVGLDIGAVSPEEVALAILAEVVAHRRGGTGTPLSAWRRV
ncbi:MAG: xanthine dehydrogenase accessory factor [Acidobacteriota bacterium]|jgi:xanthine dehydrogenase accessory factor|nr:xanthine dehydrogenase accessory factor [Acidobacteriota bacterium]